MLLKYIGSAHFRTFRPEDFSRLGVEGVQLIQWARHEVVELLDDAADALLKHHGDEFTKVTAEDKAVEASVGFPTEQPSAALHTGEAEVSIPSE
jgi:hypothetical protein